MRRTSRTVQHSASSSPTSHRRVRRATGLGRFASAGVFMTVVLSFTTVFGAFAPNAGAATSGAPSITHARAADNGQNNGHNATDPNATLTASPESATTGTSVTFTYKIVGSDEGPLSATTTWTGCSSSDTPQYSDGTYTATCTETFSQSGSYPVTATYQGNVDRVTQSNDGNGDTQSSSSSGNNGDDYTPADLSSTLTYVVSAPNSYTVTFSANGGSGSMAPETASTATALTLNTFTRSGYTFAGWNTASGGTGTTYGDGASYPFTSSATLYAQWTQNPVGCSTQSDHARTAHDDQSTDGGNGVGDTDNDGDESGAGSNCTTVTVTLIPNIPNNPTSPTTSTCTPGSGSFTFPSESGPTGYTFNGWVASGTTYQAGDTVNCPATSTTYTGSWSTTVTFVITNPSNNSSTSTADVCVVGTSVTVPTVSNNVTGYSFAGWSPSLSSSWISCDHLTYTTVWNQNQGSTTVTLIPNIPHNPTSPTTSTCTPGTGSFTFPSETGPRGYTFNGWVASGTTYQAGDTVNCPATSTTYTGSWSTTVTFVITNPSNSSSTSTAVGCVLGGTSVHVPTVPNNVQGYSFAGWSPSLSSSSTPCDYGTFTTVWNQNQVITTGNPGSPSGPSGPSGPTGPSSPSTVINTASISITNMPVAPKVESSFTPIYKTNSDGTNFTWQTSTPSTCSLSTPNQPTVVTFVAAGTCSLSVTVAATTDYSAATGSATSTAINTASISITNMPAAPRVESSFTPTYTTNSDGTNFTWQTSTPNTCSLSTPNQPTVVTFVGVGPCSLSVTVAATSDYSAATGVATSLATSAVANKPITYPLFLTVVGTGAVRSSAGSMNLHRAGSIARRFKAHALVSFVAKPLPGFVQRWSGACSGAGLTCRVTMTNAKHVRVAFRPAVTLPIFYFHTNMSNITMPPAQVARLHADLLTLVRLHVKTLTIRAYADYRNGPVYNLALSQRRANSVTAFVENLLVKSGLPRMPIKNLGMGILRASANLQLDRKAIILYI